jgi:hypothetical protein
MLPSNFTTGDSVFFREFFHLKQPSLGATLWVRFEPGALIRILSYSQLHVDKYLN